MNFLHVLVLINTIWGFLGIFLFAKAWSTGNIILGCVGIGIIGLSIYLFEKPLGDPLLEESEVKS